MAAGTKADFVIYNEQFHGGMIDRLTQVVNLFNSGSNNAIILDFQSLMGEYNRETFYKRISNFITRRDNTSTAAATILKMETDEKIGVKLNRKAGPVDQTFDAWKKIGADPATMSFVLGRMYAEEKMQDMLNTGLIAGIAAITAFGSGVSYLDTSAETTTTLTTDKLFRMKQLMGDMAKDIVCIVGHSKPYFDLVRSQITDNILDVSGINIRKGAPTTDLPFIYTDSPALLNATTTPDQYKTLGLVAGAIKITQSEPDTVFADTISGNESLLGRFQAEYAYSIEINGSKWDVANGGANPTDATLGTSTNWDKAGSTSVKTGAGVYLITE